MTATIYTLTAAIDALNRGPSRLWITALSGKHVLPYAMPYPARCFVRA